MGAGPDGEVGGAHQLGEFLVGVLTLVDGLAQEQGRGAGDGLDQGCDERPGVRRLARAGRGADDAILVSALQAVLIGEETTIEDGLSDLQVEGCESMATVLGLSVHSGPEGGFKSRSDGHWGLQISKRPQRAKKI